MERKKTYSADINTVHDLVVLATSKDVDGPLLVLGLVVGDDVRDSLGVGGDGEVADEDLGILVLVLGEVAGDGVEGGLALGLLALLLLVDNLLLDLGEAGAELLLGEDRDSETVELDGSGLDLGGLLGAVGESVDVLKLVAEDLGIALGLVGALAGVGDDTADALGDTALLDNDQVLDETSVLDVGTAAELDGDLAPLGVLGVLEKLVNLHADGDDTDGVGVGLAEDGADTLDLAGKVEINLLGVGLEVLADVVVGQILNLLDVLQRDGSLVAEIETEPVLVDERTLLVNLITQNLTKRVVQDVSTSVVVADRLATELVVLASNLITSGKVTILDEAVMNNVTTKLLNIENLELGNTIDDDATSISNLTTGLGVKVGVVEEETNGGLGRKILGGLEELLTVEDQLDLALGITLLELGLISGARDVERGLELSDLVNVELGELLDRLLDGLGSLAGLLTGLVNLGLVDGKAALFSHKLGKILGETESVIKPPDISTGELLVTALDGKSSVLLELLLTAVKGNSESNFLLIKNLLDVGLLLHELGELLAHLLHQCGEDSGEEGANLSVEVLPGVASTSAENTANDVAAADVVGGSAIGNGEGKETDMVGNNTVGGVNAIDVVLTVLVGVIPGTGNLLDLGEERSEDIGSVVGRLILEGGHQALEAHTGIDVLRREGLERLVGLSVELDEDDVPDFNHQGIVHVDEVGSIPAASDLVVMDFGARTARALVTHLPEVVLHVAGDNVVLGNTNLKPEVLGLKIRLETKVWAALEVGDIESLGIQPVDLCEELPRPRNSLLLEIIAERPVTQHLKESLPSCVSRRHRSDLVL